MSEGRLLRPVLWRPISVILLWVWMFVLQLVAMTLTGVEATGIEDPIRFTVGAALMATAIWLTILAWPLSLYALARQGERRRPLDAIPAIAAVGLPLVVIEKLYYMAEGLRANAATELLELLVILSTFATIILAARELVAFEHANVTTRKGTVFWTVVQILYLPFCVVMLKPRIRQLATARGVALED